MRNISTKANAAAAVCTALFKSPCQHTCPIEMDIPAYIALIRAERLEDAYKVLLRTNPFPSVCGRVCDHKCQSKCRRGKMDEPIAIKFLKRFITDNAPRPKIEAGARDPEGKNRRRRRRSRGLDGRPGSGTARL